MASTTKAGTQQMRKTMTMANNVRINLYSRSDCFSDWGLVRREVSSFFFPLVRWALIARRLRITVTKIL